ncbi:hypothetical protein BDP27DRAFT_1368833 [Rhodocollybia butyracea]|uniref:BAG domain-containing protein n=1 Tax=Rhodocollybia butyracea TaxID=206335 RepID=A0A9P5PFV0_9AGAR|nr:hypothetical protein BDP27DRAFT_1368833 [Rhodocollybia butyracea]
MQLTIKWGKEKTSFNIEDPSIPLRVLKESIASWTHLPYENIKLIHSGAVLKADDVPLSSYRLRPNATLQLVGSAEHIPASSGGPQKSDASTTSQIQEQLNSVRSNLVPSLQTFLDTLPRVSNPHPSTATPLTNSNATSFSPLQKEHAKLNELFLQALLNLDAIIIDTEWEQARQERKAAVKEVQGYLDRLDDAWNSRIR